MRFGTTNTGNFYMGSLTAGTGYAFPLVDGLPDQTLVTDGVGNLSFATTGSISAETSMKLPFTQRLIHQVATQDLLTIPVHLPKY